MMPTITCHCGAVSVTPRHAPSYINACNCSLCRKTGARWSYFDPADVEIKGATSRYCRTDKTAPGVDLHFCAACGVTTHFTLTPQAVAKYGDTMLGVNMSLAEDGDLAGIELRFPDGLAWSGNGGFDYRRPPHIIGQAETPC